MGRLRGCFAVAAICLFLLSGRSLPAQTTPVLTLHVYENLIQIPVLVLNTRHEPIPPVAASRFRLSIDSGPNFNPPQTRTEGDDPIALSILIVVSRTEEEILKKVGATLGEFGRISLHSRDRISVYVEDECAVSRVIFNSPPDVTDLGTAVDRVVRNAIKASHEKAGPGCSREPHLWDALGYVVQQASALSGRRVVLAITDGEDLHSRLIWSQVRTLATRYGVAIFGLQSSETPSFDFNGPASKDPEEKWRQVCELTGGLVFTATGHSMSRRLHEFAALLRDRYIVEFRRPDDITRGDHDFRVSIAGLDAFIRPAGISTPIADPKVLEDPTTVRSDPSLAPTVGKRRVLSSAPH